MEEAFEKAGYDKSYAKVTLSNRPDLCEYQCNGAMAGAKAYRKAPIAIAQDVAANLSAKSCIKEAEAVKPGFINIRLKESFAADYLNGMNEDEALGLTKADAPKMIIVDYGGPNVAKPLHVGHLRSAIIGESLKRVARAMGHKVLGDIHLGDWGYQMGLIITELRCRQPELPYFDDSFEGEYPEEAPFTISELEEIYPAASSRAKEDEGYREQALNATFLLQNGHRGYTAVWNHIMAVSVADLKKNYENLGVSFDLWKGEADAQRYIPDMLKRLKEEGHARVDDGALVINYNIAIPDQYPELLKHLEVLGTIHEAVGYLKQYMLRSLMHWMEEKKYVESRPIRQARQFIGDNYYLPLTLETVSREIGLIGERTE